MYCSTVCTSGTEIVCVYIYMYICIYIYICVYIYCYKQNNSFVFVNKEVVTCKYIHLEQKHL